MKSYMSRVYLILIIAAAALYGMLPPATRLKLGIDLSGGTILVYQIEKTPDGTSVDKDLMVAALSKRINPGGLIDVTIRPMGGDRLEIILPNSDPQAVLKIQDTIKEVGALEFRILATMKYHSNQIRDAIERRKRNEPPPQEFEWLKIADAEEFGSTGDTAIVDDEVLTMIPKEAMRVTGELLQRSSPGFDQRSTQPAVDFTFNSAGAFRFAALTRKYKPDPDGFEYRLAIVLDRKVVSAPTIIQPIEGGHGQITGRFTQDRVEKMVTILNSGKLPGLLRPDPISKDSVTATLGEDTIKKGTRAITIAMIAVPLFMIGYYWFSGLVADVALVLNIIIILGFMGFTHSTFTLPGLAGLALTVGMAVDANVLINERMREEIERGCSLGMAIRNGFDRAWFAIFDSNFTTIITGMILWFLGSDQIKGFSITLIVGLIANLFTAVFVTRTIFEIWNRQGWLTQLRMLHLIRMPNIDWVSPRFYFVGASIVVNVIALAVTFSRGTNLLDIDFTGGTAISVQLIDQTKDVDFVRDEASKVVDAAGNAILPNVKVERITPEGADKGEDLFLLRTTNKDQAAVKQAIIEQFHMNNNLLAMIEIKDVKIEAIPDASAATPSSDATKSKLAPEPTKDPATKDDSNGAACQGGPQEKDSKQADAAQAESESKPGAAKAGGDAKQDADAASKPAAATRDTKSDTAADDGSVPFAGGSRVAITMSRAINADALARKINDSLKAIDSNRVGGVERYYAIKNGDPGKLSGTFVSFSLETKEPVDPLLAELKSRLEREPIFERENNFDSQVAGETRTSAILATVLSWAAMIVYLWFRFKKASYGLAAVVSLIHDVLVALGFIALGGLLARSAPGFAAAIGIDDFKIDLTVVTAFMTIIGYSVNDTIVVFDRLREIRGKSPFVTSDMINAAVNQCMSRTILTSFTVVLVCVIMFVFGGPGIHAFSFAMGIGAFSGCYSTVFIAAPTLYFFEGPKTSPSPARGMQLQAAARA